MLAAGPAQIHIVFEGTLNDKLRGFYRLSDGRTVSFAATPGYESYRGLGWYGVVIQTPTT